MRVKARRHCVQHDLRREKLVHRAREREREEREGGKDAGNSCGMHGVDGVQLGSALMPTFHSCAH